MKKLNIGCGRDYREGWINIDISREVKADFYLDIRKDSLTYGPSSTILAGFPMETTGIETTSVHLIYISGVLEQIGSNDEFLHVMRECYRVLEPGGIMQVVVPNARYAIAHRDPMDVRKFTPETFEYFRKGAREHDLYGSVYGFDGWESITIDENERHILTIKMRK